MPQPYIVWLCYGWSGASSRLVRLFMESICSSYVVYSSCRIIVNRAYRSSGMAVNIFYSSSMMAVNVVYSSFRTVVDVAYSSFWIAVDVVYCSFGIVVNVVYCTGMPLASLGVTCYSWEYDLCWLPTGRSVLQNLMTTRCPNHPKTKVTLLVSAVSGIRNCLCCCHVSSRRGDRQQPSLSCWVSGLPPRLVLSAAPLA